MDRRYARSWVAVVLFLVVFLVASTMRRCEKNTYQYDEGLIFGTFYHITYKSDESLAEAIKQELLRFDGSLSPFNDTSLITRVNQGVPVETDAWFEQVFTASQQVYHRTGGAFEFRRALDDCRFSRRIFLVEAQTLVYACRIIEDGLVNIVGVKENVLAAALPAADTDKARGTLKALADKEGYQTFVIPDDITAPESICIVMLSGSTPDSVSVILASTLTALLPKYADCAGEVIVITGGVSSTTRSIIFSPKVS